MTETSESGKRRMDAYYYGFDETGCDPIDDVLEAVARAGKAFHHTDQWSNPDFGLKPGELCETDKIQNAAIASAEAVKSALASAEARGRVKGLEDAAKIAAEHAKNAADEILSARKDTDALAPTAALCASCRRDEAVLIAAAIRAAKEGG